MCVIQKYRSVECKPNISSSYLFGSQRVHAGLVADALDGPGKGKDSGTNHLEREGKLLERNKRTQ